MRFNMIQKGLCVLLSLFLAFSAAMTGTCAWRDITQHKSNEFYGRGTAEPDTTTKPDTTTEPDTTTPEPTTPEPTTTIETTTVTSTITTTTTQPTTEPSTTTTETTTRPLTINSVTTTTAIATTKPQNSSGPKTGDTGNVWLWAVVTIVSAVSLRAVLLWGKRGGRRETEIGGLL